jgi:hypothetical protein
LVIQRINEDTALMGNILVIAFGKGEVGSQTEWAAFAGEGKVLDGAGDGAGGGEGGF